MKLSDIIPNASMEAIDLITVCLGQLNLSVICININFFGQYCYLIISTAFSIM